MADEPNKMRAEIRARQAEDGKKAMAEYEANAAATRAKTEKLPGASSGQGSRRSGGAQAGRRSKTKAKRCQGEKEGGTRASSDWLEGQADSGRKAPAERPHAA